MGFTGSWPANKDYVLGILHKFTTVQGSDKDFINLTFIKLKSRQITISRELCRLHLVINRTDISFSYFGFEQQL